MARKKPAGDVSAEDRGAGEPGFRDGYSIHQTSATLNGKAAAFPSPGRGQTKARGVTRADLMARALRLGARFTALGGGRNEYVSSAFGSPVNKVLDVGCSYGWALDSLRGKAGELWGIDTDGEALRHARARYSDIHFVHGSATSLPFPSDTFDAVVLSETIEHVADGDRSRVVDEVHRVLKNGGLLVFTAPYAGLLAWTDPLDFKRRIPSVYRLYMRAARYTPTTPVEVGHKHLSTRDIAALFRNRFDLEEIRFCGLVTPFVTWALVLGTRLHLLPRPLEDALNRFRAWESGVPYGPLLAFNVRLLARKKAT